MFETYQRDGISDGSKSGRNYGGGVSRCDLSLVCMRERSDLSHIGTHAGGRPTETHTINGRIKRLETTVLKST